VASFPSRLWQPGMTGSRTMDGRLEVYYQQRWRTVCDEMFGDEEARVICSTISLGLLRYVTTTFQCTRLHCERSLQTLCDWVFLPPPLLAGTGAHWCMRMCVKIMQFFVDRPNTWRDAVVKYRYPVAATQPFNGPLSGTTPVGRLGTRKVKPIWILLKQETVSGSGISWTICKSAPHSRQITTPALHPSVFLQTDALPAAQPTA